MSGKSKLCSAVAAAIAVFGLSATGRAAVTLYYNFQEGTGTTALDSAGTPQNGTLTGGPTYATGAAVPAGLNSSTPSAVLSFDGDNDLVETGLPPSAFNIEGGKPKAVSAWVYTETFNNGGIFDTGSNEDGRDFSLRTLGPGPDTWRAQFWGGPDYDFTTPTQNQWVNFVQTYDGTTSRTYKNGVLVGFKAAALNTNDLGRTFAVGVYNATENFDGFIDDFAIYDQNLTQAQALSLFNGASPLSIPEPGSLGLVAAGLLWPLLRRRPAKR